MASGRPEDVERALPHAQRGVGNVVGEGYTDDSDGPPPQDFSLSPATTHSNFDNREHALDLDRLMLWLFNTEGRSLIGKVRPWPFLEKENEGIRESYRINLAELQRLRLQELQYKLIGHVKRMHIGEDEKGDWRDDLQQYVQALQNHDYMEKCSTSARDPFLVTGERRVCRIGLDAARFAGLDDREMRLEYVTDWEDGSKPYLPIPGTRGMNQARRFANRVAVAATGGAFLIGPMWLMVLHRTIWTALVSTTVCVAAFGLMMAFIMEKYMDILSSTAAYAAVLMVFVGLIVSS